MSGLSPTTAEISLRRVSLALITLGILDVLPGFALFWLRPFSYARRGPVGAGADSAAEQFAAIAGIALSLLSLPIGALVLAGGIVLLQRRARLFGVISANVAMLPFSCWFVAGLPVGYWAATVLGRDDVRALFPVSSRGSAPPGRRRQCEG